MLLPDTTFYMRERDDTISEGNPFKWVYKTTKDIFTDKKVVVIGLPGAFTPTCSTFQLPLFEAMYEKFKELGVDEIYCTSVNDAFVMFKWSCDLGVEKVKMLPDGNGDFAKELGMLVDKRNLGFGPRSWRYVMYVDNMDIVKVWEEPGKMNNCPTDPFEVSDAENVFSELKHII